MNELSERELHRKIVRKGLLISLSRGSIDHRDGRRIALTRISGPSGAVDVVDLSEVHLLFPVAGRIEAQSAGKKQELLTPGEAVLVRGQPLRLLGSEFTLVLVTFGGGPESIAEFLGISGLPNQLLVKGSSVLNRPAASFFGELAGQDSKSGANEWLEPTERLLLRHVTIQNFHMDGPPSARSFREGAMELIALHAHNPDFTVKAMARHIGISPRHLQRSFLGMEGPAELLRKRRVGIAMNLLRDPEYARLSFGQIASASGFSDARALRRSILLATGLSLKDARGQGSGEPASSSPSSVMKT